MDIHGLQMAIDRVEADIILKQISESHFPLPEAFQMFSAWYNFSCGLEWGFGAVLLRFSQKHIVVAEEINGEEKKYLILLPDGFYLLTLKENMPSSLAACGPFRAAEIALAMGLNTETFISRIKEELERIINSV